ncbi:hypothetical protein DWA23_10700, partial [Acinetobacter baumannii]
IHKYLYKYNNLIFNLYYFFIKFLKLFNLELKIIIKKLFKSKNLQNLGLCVSKLRIGETLILNNDKKLKIYN